MDGVTDASKPARTHDASRWPLAVAAGALAAAIHAASVSLSSPAAGAAWSPVPLGSSLALFALVALAVTWVARRARATHARERATLERLVSDARLETLRTQLDPHFVFNALNAISAHLDQNPGEARWMLDQLGSLLRMSLEQAREQQTPLARELDFISCYLHLQKARFDDRLEVAMTIAPDVRQALVPSLVLQPLVENAIRHGVAKQPAARIEISAWRDADRLRLRVHDDGPGLPADWDPELGFGVGLSITRERLQRLYGEAQAFAIEGGPGAGVQVSLTLPFREAEAGGVGGDGLRGGGTAAGGADPDGAGAAERAATTAGAARTRTADDSPGS